jgi:hypothetical protein
MTTLNMKDAAVEGAVEQDAARAGGGSAPMPQQAASHGYDFYPQTFVRLIGCHQSRPPVREATRAVRKTAA